LYNEKRWPEARDAYLRYLESHPEAVDVISDLGICYRALGDLQRALKEFDRALAIAPAHWQSLYNKIIVLAFDLGKKSEARELVVRLRTLQPENEQVKKLAEAVEGN
jgi:tetratricopeptide (TPR) repeat protein